jgi:hypothetical protein
VGARGGGGGGCSLNLHHPVPSSVRHCAKSVTLARMRLVEINSTLIHSRAFHNLDLIREVQNDKAV